MSKTEDLDIARNIVDFLRSLGVDVYAAREYERNLLNLEIARKPEELDCAVVIGGDGTVLRYVQECSDEMIDKMSIFHVGTGRVNFFSDVTGAELRDALSSLLSGRYYIDQRDLIRAESPEGTCRALNEVMIRGARPGQLLTIRVYEIAGGEEALIIEGRMDGVIVSTPTGSTAYSLAAGGPVVDLRVKAKVITPLAPFTRAFAPIVHPLDVAIRVCADADLQVVCDGVKSLVSNSVVIRRDDRALRFIRTRPLNYYARLLRRLFTV